MSPEETRVHLLDVVSQVQAGCLEFTWAYSENLHRVQTVRRLAQELLAALREIVEHCASPGAGGRTPSDFPLARLKQAGVDRLVGDGRGVEDIYPLSPMQAGMVFHGLVDTTSGAYLNQVSLRLGGVSDPQAMGLAWQYVVDRTPVLRSWVVWEGVEHPLQVVQREVRLPVSHLDWTGLSEADQAEELRQLLARDRALGLDVGAAPLLRVTVARVSDEQVVMVWTVHHVLLDGWSAAAVFEEVCEQYTALVGGRAAMLMPRRPFGDYLGWLAAQDHAGAQEYWRRALSGFDSPTALPYDRAPREAHRAESGHTAAAVLTAEQSARLREVAQRNGLTVNTLVQGAWAVLLARYSGQRDVVFGTTVAGRPADLSGVESMVGMFINTIPTRVRVPHDQDLLTWLAGIQLAQADARRFDFVSLAQLQSWSGLPGGTSLFDSIVVFENYPINDDTTHRHGLHLHESAVHEPTNYPLTLVVLPTHQLNLTLDYDPTLFDTTTINQITSHLHALLDNISQNPNHTVGELPMLTDTEITRVLVEWNNTTQPVTPTTLPELFEQQVIRTPHATAVIYDNHELTYTELNTRANQLAHQLISAGVGPEGCVAVMLPRSLDLIVALLAVLKSGAAYLPIDPDYPAERIEFVLEDARPVVVLDKPAMVTDVAGYPETNPVDADRIYPLVADHPAYVIYTSGSTGRPKGVMVDHNGIVNRLSWMQAEYGLTADDRVLQKTPSSFDVSVWEFFWSLIVGATLVVARPEGHKDPGYLVEVIQSARVSTVHFVPSMLRAFVHDPAAARCTG
ncbi:MAG: condensation domain-containing protein, partial [Actinobacteria bacterium]|nr:condensation domain-containing protein [Actinomycetota bacterium]